MKKIKLTKRRLAGGAILLVAALLGVFSGTYAKYLSTIDLPKTDDQTGNVAVWQVGQSVVMGNLFAPYYYGSDVEDGSGDAGHTAPQESSDTVFAKGIYNLVAPGTKGEKTIQLVDKLDDTKGETEVAYKVEFSNPGSEINGGKIVNFTNDTDGKLASRLQFKLLIAKNEKDEGKTSLWNVKTSGLDGWTNAAGLEEALKAQTLWYNGSAFDYSIKIMWQWPFETDDLANTSDMLAQATSASLSVSFGTARYEQVDSYEPVQTGLKIEWDTTIQEFKVEIAGESWIVLHQEGDKALVIRDTVLTVKEATSVINEGDKEYQTPLIDDAANPKYFFSSTGENGYLTSPVYKAIEHYYTNSIVASGDDKYVVAVNLNTPTFEEFRTTPFAPKLIPYPYPSPSGDVAYNNWEWSSDILKGELDYFRYRDSRFATKISDKEVEGDGDSLKSSGTGYQKQAFALSLGDIWKIDEVWAGAPYDIGLRVRIGDEYWLRSPGVCQDWGAAVDDGDFNDSMPTTSNLGVCPAMYVYVNNWKEDVAP